MKRLPQALVRYLCGYLDLQSHHNLALCSKDIYDDCNSKIALQHQPPLDISRFANVTNVMENPLLLQHQNLVFNGGIGDLESVPKMLRKRLSSIETRQATSVFVLAELLRIGQLTKTNLWFPREKDDNVDEIKDIAAVIAANESLTSLNLVYNHMRALNMSTILEKGLMCNRSITRLDISEDFYVMSEIIDSLCRVIRYNSTITVLNIANCRIGPEHGSILANALRENKTLKELDISYNSFNRDVVVEIIAALQANPSLKVLCITNVDMGSEGAIALASLLDETNPLSRCRLIKLSMFSNHIGESGIRAIAHSLASNKTLQNIEFGISFDTDDDNEIGDLAVQHIALALLTNTGLTHLNLSKSGAQAKGAELLAAAIGKNRTLKRLSLGDNRNFGTGLQALVGLGGENGCCLEALKLSNCSIDLANLGLLVDSLQRTPTITELDLRGNSFFPSPNTDRILSTIISRSHLKKLNLSFCCLRTVDGIASALIGTSSLRELCLDNNAYFGYRRICELAAALKTNTTLETLSLRWCDIGKNGDTYGASALADALTVNRSLRSLNLDDNPLGEKGIRPLADALTYNSSLRCLSVNYTECEDGGAAAFAHALAHGSSIIELDLGNCDITNTGAIALARGVTLNTKLRRLNLTCNKIARRGIGVLKQALLQNLSLEEINVMNNYGGEFVLLDDK
jgi:Ran GTPase-activating protein (RanGAP) involved in mRNA processing and transport